MGENFFCSATPHPLQSIRLYFFSSPSRSADSFLCHRMNETAPPSILWPVFARKPVFCGHRMNKWALPSILWPSGQRLRSFLQHSRGLARKTSLKGRLFPGRAENNLYIFVYGCRWQGCGRWSGMGFSPGGAAGGSVEGPPRFAEENPSVPAGPDRNASKNFALPK